MKVVLWFLMMFMPLMANASSVNEEQLFHRLDSYIAQRSKFTQRKEAGRQHREAGRSNFDL